MQGLQRITRMTLSPLIAAEAVGSLWKPRIGRIMIMLGAFVATRRASPTFGT
jgi:hypothetical protein